MKTGFTIICILGALFMMFFATFNICISYSNKNTETITKRITHLEHKCDSLEKQFIDYQINNRSDTIVLSIVPQRVNFNYNIKNK